MGANFQTNFHTAQHRVRGVGQTFGATLCHGPAIPRAWRIWAWRIYAHGAPTFGEHIPEGPRQRHGAVVADGRDPGLGDGDDLVEAAQRKLLDGLEACVGTIARAVIDVPDFLALGDSEPIGRDPKSA